MDCDGHFNATTNLVLVLSNEWMDKTMSYAVTRQILIKSYVAESTLDPKQIKSNETKRFMTRNREFKRPCREEGFGSHCWGIHKLLHKDYGDLMTISRKDYGNLIVILLIRLLRCRKVRLVLFCVEALTKWGLFHKSRRTRRRDAQFWHPKSSKFESFH